tara:strand:+ start:469 stop:720 length:252 start_codon:yes stop_codon:yes gene_type:complete
MKETFENKIKVKVNTDKGIVHLSISPSDYKVEVFKLSVEDMSHLVSSFSAQLQKDKASQNGTMIAPVLPGDEDNSTEEENNNN